MADVERVIGRSADLVDGGAGIRFQLRRFGPEQANPTGGEQAFVVRWQGQVRAYVNRCRHQATELDWNEGDFFDETKQFLVCATHGALYRPSDGYCVAGPCAGARLDAVEVREDGGAIYAGGLASTNDVRSTYPPSRL